MEAMDDLITFPTVMPLSRAHKVLENLYLGAPGDYLLYFSRDQLPKVEDIFDIIIFTHGIKPVYFKYVISSPSVWSGSPEQRLRVEKAVKKISKVAS